ncbi:MAG: metallophosphoesterase [Syntrophomonadaceae bacterium]
MGTGTKLFGVKMKRKSVASKILYLVGAIVIVGLLYNLVSSYQENQPKLQYVFNQNGREQIVYPDSSFAVISDLHYYDPSLGTTGPAFEACLYSDRKLLRDGPDLLKLTIDEIIKSKVDFVLIPGDLSKDGELVCHQKVAEELAKLTQNGIKVYVIPGNHDINNPLAYQYQGDQTIPVAAINAEQFADIYKDYGYASAIYRDSDSLSYVAEPVNNLWIIALDVCRYRENVPGKEETIGGRLTQSQEKWLESMLAKANASGKAVLFMEHHGVVEHWTGQSKLHPDYLLEDYKNFGRLLASYHVPVVFTGHYHAQDITLAQFDGGHQLYDIETGSLLTDPCPIRFCAIADNKLEITSKKLVGELHPGTDFKKNADQFLFDTIEREAYDTLRGYHVPEKDAHTIANFVTAGFVAHYQGDEDISEKPGFDESRLGLLSRVVYSTQKYVVDGIWQDLPPADNHLTIAL